MNRRRINAAGLSLVKQWEGLQTKAYQDVADVWTIGYGHTSAAGAPVVKPGMVITEAKAEELLCADLSVSEERVERLVKVPLNDNQYAVLVSFGFNTGKLHSSTLLKKLYAGNNHAVPAELMKWVHAGGERVKGLVYRRSADAALWASGNPRQARSAFHLRLLGRGRSLPACIHQGRQEVTVWIRIALYMIAVGSTALATLAKR